MRFQRLLLLGAAFALVSTAAGIFTADEPAVAAPEGRTLEKREQPPAPPAPAAAAPAASGSDRIIVRFHSHASEQAIAALNASQAVEQVEALPALGLRVLRVPQGRAAAQVLAAYANHPLVEFAEPDALIAPEAVPNDTYYGNAWHLPVIQAAQAWDSARATGVLIAVCDTGVEASHPDLSPILRGDLGWNTVSNSSDWSPIASHGTAVAGVAAAVTNNGIGVSGIAWGAQVIPVRISNLTDGSAYISDAAECIQYAADRGARVINLSYRMASYAAIDSAAAYAESRGAVTTVSAGNDAIDPGWPDFPTFLAVSATTSSDTLASFSNYGTYVDVAAPGSSLWTTRVGATYGGFSGTSAAAPAAAGVLALIFGANPSLTAAQAKSILLNSADDLGAVGEDPQYGAGRVNAARAVLAALGGAPAPDTTPPSVSVSAPAAGAIVSGTITVAANAQDNVGVTRVEFFAGATLIDSDTSAPFSATWNTTNALNGSVTLSARAFDAAGNAATSAGVSVTVQNPVGDTTAPLVSITSPAAGVTISGTITVGVSASDNVGVTRVEWYLDGALQGSATLAPYTFSWNTAGVADGSHTLSAKAYDAAGNVGTAPSVTVTVQNTPSTITETFQGSVGGRMPLRRSHQVSVAREGPMSIHLSWGGKANLDFALYDSAGALISSGTRTSGSPEATTVTVPAGTYTIVVTAVSGKANYTLTVTHY